ncbi:MAG: hypothetical protein SOW20_08325 [Berryella intestinalis]|uniref:hypothetical protein n=1 Tax=Berryella intestinalis TaxID=1531429 RepID=UPI002A74C935|nr:hypothetical protein [Berryella intestinalis]MDY3130007.1 hypothetical protein [Berryella intestinalis]
MAELVTGFGGKPHVTAAQARRFNVGTLGVGAVVLKTQQKFAATQPDANHVTVDTGDAIMKDGSHVCIEAPETATIESGSQGMKRIDIVGIRVSSAHDTGVESAALAVVKGEPSAGTAAVPGFGDDFLPLYRVELDGINAKPPVAMFSFAATASDAASAAGAAQGRADSAHSLAQTAKARADAAYSLAQSAKSTADSAYGNAKVLYDNPSGTSGNFSLSETAANFAMIDVHYKSNDGNHGSTSVYKPNGKAFNLSSTEITATGGTGWQKSRHVLVDGTSVSNVGFAGDSGIGGTSGGTNTYGVILITAVIGHRRVM